MSSYLDKIPQFNPYIQQLPVDAYVKVGMYKQQQYDEGVQKVQSYIDNIAGLDIMKESDKDYLRSKVDGLTSQISRVAGADFSNKNIVNQISGLTSKIAGDQNIMNAVNSTSYIRKLNDSYDQLSKSKPELYSNANRAYDNQFVEQYLTNREVGEVYSGPKEATVGSADSVRKRIMDEVQKFKENKSTYIDGATGALMYRVSEKEGVSEDRIREYVQGTLSANENDLLHKDAWFNYRGLKDTQLVESVARDYKSKLDAYTMYKKNYTDLANASSDNDTKLQYQKQANGYQKAIDEITANSSNLNNFNTKALIGGLDENEKSTLRDYVYKEGFMRGIVAGGSNEKLTSTFKVNEAVKFQIESQQKQQEMENRLMITAFEKGLTGLINADGSFNWANFKAGKLDNNGVYTTPATIDVNDTENITTINDNTLDKQTIDATLEYGAYQSDKYKYIYGLSGNQDKFIVNKNYTPEGEVISVTPKPEFKAEIDSQILQISTNKNLANKGLLQPGFAIPGDSYYQNADEKQKESIFKIGSANELKANIYNQAERELIATGKIKPTSSVITIKNNNGVDVPFKLSEISDLYQAQYLERRSGIGGEISETNPVNEAKIQKLKSLNLNTTDLNNKLGSELNRINSIKSKVEEIYKNVSSANNPFLTITALNKKDANYLNTTAAVATMLQTQNGVVLKSDDINIEGGTVINGKRKLQITYDEGTGDKKHTVRTFVDVDNLSGSNTWLSKTFYNDSNPDLTSTIRLSNNKRTPDPVTSDNSINSAALSTLTNSNNKEISRAYQIIQATTDTLEGNNVEPGKFYLKVAIPIDNSGKSNLFQPLIKQGYTSAGEAQQFINSMYSSKDGAKVLEYTLMHPEVLTNRLSPIEILKLANQ